MLVVFIIAVVVVFMKLNSKLYNFSHDVYSNDEFLYTMERLKCRSELYLLNVYSVILWYTKAVYDAMFLEHMAYEFVEKIQ